MGTPLWADASVSSWTRSILLGLEARGVDPTPLVAQAGLDPTSFADPDARFDVADTGRLWRAAVETTGDPSFGLDASRFVNHTTFKSLLNDTRRDLACAYLREGRMSLTELTFLLGFTNTSSFSRAFKRWTGRTPSEFAQTSGRQHAIQSPLDSPP